MPGDSIEMARLAHMLANDEVAVDHIEDVHWSDGSRISGGERREACALAIFIIRRRARLKGRPQRRALRLLRSFLSPEQRRQLCSSGEFIVVGSAGGTYRLSARVGRVWQIERHKTRYFARKSFCFHDPDDQMPPADETIGHLFHLLSDEAGFLAEANSRENGLWDGEWLRTLNRARRERQAECAPMEIAA